MVTVTTHNPESHVLTAEGNSIAASGSHEFLVWSALGKDPLTAKALEAVVGADVAKIGQGKAMRNKWIRKEGDGFVRAVSPAFGWRRGRSASGLGEQDADLETSLWLCRLSLLWTRPSSTCRRSSPPGRTRTRSSWTSFASASLSRRSQSCPTIPSLRAADGVSTGFGALQENVLLRGGQGRQLCDDDREARGGPHRRAPQLVSLGWKCRTTLSLRTLTMAV